MLTLLVLKMATSKRNELTLKKKVEVIEYVKNNPGAGSRKLASIFGCGKTQIQTILLKKESIIADFEKNAPEGRKRCRSTAFAEVNDAVYKWYCLARQRNIPISGPLLQEEALEIAKTIDPDTQFKASNGWLDSFKRRHNIKQMTVSGECGDVREETVAGWLERLRHNAVNSEGLHAHLGASSVGVVKRLRHKHSCAASMG